MANFLKSLFLVWIPVGLILSLIHNVFWGPWDISSFYLGAAFILISQVLDFSFGFRDPNKRPF